MSAGVESRKDGKKKPTRTLLQRRAAKAGR